MYMPSGVYITEYTGRCSGAGVRFVDKLVHDFSVAIARCETCECIHETIDAFDAMFYPTQSSDWLLYNAFMALSRSLAKAYGCTTPLTIATLTPVVLL